MSVVICEGCGVRNLPNTAIIELTNGTFPLCPQCRTELRAALAAHPAPAADDAGLGPTGKPRCPKCGNSFQNGTPADAPGFQRCATCKHVWQPYPSAPDADNAGRAVTELRTFLAMLDHCKSLGYGIRYDYNPSGTAVQVEHPRGDEDEFYVTEWAFDSAGTLVGVHHYKGEVG